MNYRRTTKTVLSLGSFLLFAFAVRAEPVWVSDQFEVMLRTGPSTDNAIQRVIRSGTQLELLERDSAGEYSRVRTTGGTEGWVLNRYLMDEPSAREQLERLTSELTNATSQGSSMSSQLNSVKSEYAAATTQIASLERDKQALQAELDDIQEKAANVLAIDRQNKELRQQLTDAEIKVSILEQENSELASQTTRNWFLAGGLVLLIGVVLGLWLPRIRWQKRSGYERF
ncbi:MAG: TIGR04211 family SH3 domain-containing protein [Woeseiaceae bacterium]